MMIPPRTLVRFDVRLEILNPGAPVVEIKSYSCADCDFETDDYQKMVEHQAGRQSIRGSLSHWVKSTF